MGRAETGVLRAGQQAEGSGVGMDQPTAADQVTTLYRVHGMDLIRIAAVMLGSRAGAEDAVQDAFYGFYRRGDQLPHPPNPPPPVPSAGLNPCRAAQPRPAPPPPPAAPEH